MKKNRHIIASVREDSIARELDMEAGDEVVEINGKTIGDIFDYQYLVEDSYIEVLVRKVSGEEWLLEIEKDPDEDLGLVFENSFMDEYRSCRNRCVFCFIDQMPQGMRDTLYFKDDDSRLSFLQGNYVTLTNMSDHDLDRIIAYRMEPINISFHTTNPDLRCQMLHNRSAGDFFGKLDRLAEAGIRMNGQIVLCRGLNDGEELDRSIRELLPYAPTLSSLSVVPVGLTKFREGLYPLQGFDREASAALLDQIASWQEVCFREKGIHFVHASDEWYLQAGRDFPPDEIYDGFCQIENGVGMMRLLEREVAKALSGRRGDERRRRVSLATGRLASGFMRDQARAVCALYPGLAVRVYEIRNDFFGETITVSGLITGGDLKAQLAGLDLGEELLLPCNMFRAGEEVFLDDVTKEDLEKELRIRIRVVDQDGEALVRALIGAGDSEHKRRQIYEQSDSSSSR